MKSEILKTKNEWCTPDLQQKIAQNPKLLKALQDPQFSKVIDMMAKDPKKAMETYKDNKEFTQLLLEFSGIMGNHFDNVAAKEAEENEDPVMKTINTDEEVKKILEDPQIQKFLHQLQTQGGIDLFEVMRKDVILGNKLKVLISKGVLNTSATL